MPMAVIGGLVIASIVYILANIAYFTILLPEDILNSDAVATVSKLRLKKKSLYLDIQQESPWKLLLCDAGNCGHSNDWNYQF